MGTRVRPGGGAQDVWRDASLGAMPREDAEPALPGREDPPALPTRDEPPALPGRFDAPVVPARGALGLRWQRQTLRARLQSVSWPAETREHSSEPSSPARGSTDDACRAGVGAPGRGASSHGGGPCCGEARGGSQLRHTFTLRRHCQLRARKAALRRD